MLQQNWNIDLLS